MKRAISIILALLILTITVNFDFSALAISKETSIDTIVTQSKFEQGVSHQVITNYLKGQLPKKVIDTDYYPTRNL